MINGVNYDFESIKVQLPSGATIMPESITWNDEKADEIIRNKHGIPIGVGRGQYSGGGSLELGYADYISFRSAVSAAGGGFYNAHAIPISIAYADPGEPVHTVQLTVKCKKRDYPTPESTAKVKVDFEFVAVMIEDGQPAYVPGV